MTEQKPNLLPIGSRVTHFTGDPAFTHGKGTIIAYNRVNPNNYLRTNFTEAVAMAGKAGLLDGLVNSFYDGTRCPYVIRFDLHPSKLDKYQKGYKDVYELDSVHPLSPEENIFPSDDVLFMMRTWSMVVDEGKSMSYPAWSNWAPITHDEYQKLLRNENPDIEFCIRPHP